MLRDAPGGRWQLLIPSRCIEAARAKSGRPRVTKPAGNTPNEVIQAIQKAAKAALDDPRFVKGMDTMGANVHWGNAADYQKLMTNEDKFMQDMVDSGKIKTS